MVSFRTLEVGLSFFSYSISRSTVSFDTLEVLFIIIIIIIFKVDQWHLS
jgi:hypothetical protein